MLCAAAICCQSTQGSSPLGCTDSSKQQGWLDGKAFHHTEGVSFWASRPRWGKKFPLPLRIAEKLQIKSMLRKLLVTQDAEPGRSKTPQ